MTRYPSHPRSRRDRVHETVWCIVAGAMFAGLFVVALWQASGAK